MDSDALSLADHISCLHRPGNDLLQTRTCVDIMHIVDEYSLEADMPVSTKGRDPARRATNVTLPQTLVQDAKALRINVSQACEQGLAVAVSDAKAKKWQDENRAAFAAWNDYVEQNGVPLAEFRQF
jgi:antitoxin CcdA